jgi:ribosomal-protein-alanine N-acetyltransferase
MQSRRLNIRTVEKKDEAFIYQLKSNPLTYRYVEMKPYQSLADARKFIKSVLKDIDHKEAYYWCLESRETHQCVGTICLWNFDDELKHAEIGYEILPEHYQNGYATEAVAEVVAFAASLEQLDSIIAITHEANIASIRMLEKLNFKCKGIATKIYPEIEESDAMHLYELLF